MTKTVLALSLVALMACKAENRTGQPETDTTGTPTAETSTATATTPGVSGGAVSTLSAEDKEFIVKAGMAGLYEVQAGNLALQKAASADVKQYAQRMVTDHGTANTELAQLAMAKGVTLPSELHGEHQSAFEHLSTLSGAEFDKAYMQHMVPDHQKDVAEFERAAGGAADAEVKAWAGKILPTLREHLQMATTVGGKV
jgi:putative membrane protein